MPAADSRPKSRPVYLDLLSIRQPLPAIVSILHRASGFILFAVGIPVVLYVIQASLNSAEDYAAIKAYASSPLAKLVLLGLCWAYLHHLFAGIRHLLADIHIGIDLPGARRSGAIVLVLALLTTAAIALRLW